MDGRCFFQSQERKKERKMERDMTEQSDADDANGEQNKSEMINCE
jgi:hypothetical protein